MNGADHIAKSFGPLLFHIQNPTVAHIMFIFQNLILQDPNLLFGPYNWNPSAGSKEYCSWDSPSLKNCKHHNYEKGLIHLVHAAGAEIYPSLGGWTLSDAFPAMAASASARAKFTQNCIDLVKEYGFDGKAAYI